MNPSQITALLIFIIMFILIVWDPIERHYVTLSCGLLTIVCVFGISMRSFTAIQKALAFSDIAKLSFWHTFGASEEASCGINWETIIFIAGMMIMVEGMSKAGFFSWLCMKLAKAVNYRPIPLMMGFMIMSFVLSMFIDSITVILFLVAVTVELGKLLKTDPVPIILSEIFCANLGGSATMCGDPPNIIIGTSLHYTFMDFLTNTGVIAFVCLALILVYYYLIFRKQLSNVNITKDEIAAMPAPEDAIENTKSFYVSVAIFLTAVILLVSHSATGLTIASIGTIIASITLIASGKNAPLLIKKVDYKNLLFFIGLFVVVSGLEQTHILELIAGIIGKASGNNLYIMIAIIIWMSAIASAIVDNIPFAATMIPIIRSLAATQGVDLSTLAWTLALGTDIGGSATPIGASANVVGISVAAKNGHFINWAKYCKASIPATVIVITVSMIMLFLRYV